MAGVKATTATLTTRTRIVCYRCGKTAGHISRCCPEREMAPERGEAANPRPAAKVTGRPRIHHVSGGCSPTRGCENATPCGDART